MEQANCSLLSDKGCVVDIRESVLHWYLPSSWVQSSLECRHSSHPVGGRFHHGDTGRIGSI